MEQTPLSGDGAAVVELLQEIVPSAVDAKKTEQVLPLQEETASEPSSASSPMDTPSQRPPEVETAQMNSAPPETIEKFGQVYNVYHRETLYQEVWAMPVTEVAKRYKVSDVAIHKVCKSLNIPTPPQGYWAKLRAGKPVKKLPLLPRKEQTKLGIQNGISRLTNPGKTTASLELLPEEERASGAECGGADLAAAGACPYAAGNRGAPKADCRMEQEKATAGAGIRRKLEPREERRLRYNAEVDRTLALVNCASDYEIACIIRSYVSAMEKSRQIRIFLHGRLGLVQKRVGTTLQSQKRTNFWASGNMKRIKRVKGLSTRDTGGKAKVCAPSDLDRIVVDLSILINNY